MFWSHSPTARGGFAWAQREPGVADPAVTGSERGIAVRGVRRTVESVVSLLPYAWQTRLAGLRVLPLFYHIVTDRLPPYLSPPPYRILSAREFESELDALLRRFQAIDLKAVIDAARHGRAIPRNTFLLTFDDGYRESSEIAAPILLRKGVPATFFLCSAFMNNSRLFVENKAGMILNRLQSASRSEQERVHDLLKNAGISALRIGAQLYGQENTIDEIAAALKLDWADVLDTYRPYLCHGEIRGLLRKGFTVGAHSIDHPLYSLLSMEEQSRQTHGSLNAICGEFGLNYRAFAFPYSEQGVDQAFFDKMLGGNEVDVFFGTRGIVEDELGGRCIQRMWGEDTSGPLSAHLDKEVTAKLLRRVRGRDLVHRVA